MSGALSTSIVGAPTIGFQPFAAGILESVFVIHLGGLVLAAIVLLCIRQGNLTARRAVP